MKEPDGSRNYSNREFMQWRSKTTVDVVDQWAEGRNLSTQQQDGSRNKSNREFMQLRSKATVDVVDQRAEGQ